MGIGYMALWGFGAKCGTGGVDGDGWSGYPLDCWGWQILQKRGETKNILLFNFTGAFKCKCHDGNEVDCAQIFTNHARMFLLYKTYFVLVFMFCIKHIPSEPRTQRPVFTSRQEMHKRAALGNACRWVTQSVSDWYFSDFQIINVNQLRWMITDDNYYHGLSLMIDYWLLIIISY